MALSLVRAQRVAIMSFLACAASAPALGPIEVIFSSAPGHDSARVPGIPSVRFSGWSAIALSPDGTRWAAKALVGSNTSSNDVIVLDDGSGPRVIARQNDPIPGAPPLRFGDFDVDLCLNNAGMLAVGCRLERTTHEYDEALLVYEPAVGWRVALREGDPLPGLRDLDPGYSGDELLGNALDSARILNDGRLAFRVEKLQQIDADVGSAIYLDGAPIIQEGGQVQGGGGRLDAFLTLDGHSFALDRGGTRWAAVGDVSEREANSPSAVIVDGVVRLKRLTRLSPDLPRVERIRAVGMTPGGAWYARGSLADGSDFATIEGAETAAGGRGITPSAAEHWSAPFFSFTATDAGDWLVVGTTDRQDAGSNVAAVLNGRVVAARIGDAVDMDRDGLADTDYEIESFLRDRVVLTEDRWMYAIVTLRRVSKNKSVGAALVRARVDDECPADFDADGDADLFDMLAFQRALGLEEPRADLAEPFGEFNLFDFLAYQTAFGSGC